MKIVKLLCVVLMASIAVNSYAQPHGLPDPDQAKEHFGHGNYIMALPIYLQLLKKEPNNLEYNYRAGICYLHNHGNKAEAVKYFEAATKDPKCDNDGWLFLGQAYHYALRFDDAIKAYQKYEENANNDGKAQAEHYIAQCKNGKILVAHPLDVSFQDLGPEVNSEYPDYYPYVTSDESMLVFTSRRKGNIGATSVEMDGYYSSDIYVSKSLNGTFQKARSAGPAINGKYDEECTGLSADGQWMTVYIDNITSAGDIYLSNFNHSSFGKPVKMTDNSKGETYRINGGFETAGSFSPDQNMFFFSSKRKDGLGATDIYVCKKLPGDFGWSMPTNLGPAINTEYDEDFPFMAPDGKTLYFSSEGHNSMGGHDIFYTVWDADNNSWSTPRNVGYPVNGPGDDLTICYTANDRVAYITSEREGGKGSMDIWRVVFNEVQQNSFTVVTGKIITPDSTIKPSDLEILVSDASTNEDFGSYRPSPSSGTYVMALPPGKYIMSLDAPGCKPYVETVIVFDIGPQGEMSKDILLTKQ